MFEGSVTARCRPEDVFALYADASSWARWDPDIESATRDGPFAPGTRGSIKPREGPTTKIVVTKVDPNRAFTAEARLPLCTMHFEHEVVPVGTETKITHRVRFTGPLAFLFARLIGKQLKYGIPRTMLGLKHALEGGPGRG
ncbi:MAG: SRPBCC family protein [Gemmatimonadaceae bacterium]|jgi:uncharacterized protein YndB with AHSA1/START domain|nr:SRPBCC family protein [Gemmatimonadaceae bacterium]